MLTSFILETSPILNDKCQLQAYPLVIANPIDADEFSMYGLSLMEFAEKKVEDGKFLIIKANGMTDMKKVKKSPSTYCLGQIVSMYGDRDKGLFVCFQVAIDGTAKQHDIHSNGKRAIKSAREKAFAKMHSTRKSKLPRVSLKVWDDEVLYRVHPKVGDGEVSDSVGNGEANGEASDSSS